MPLNLISTNVLSGCYCSNYVKLKKLLQSNTLHFWIMNLSKIKHFFSHVNVLHAFCVPPHILQLVMNGFKVKPSRVAYTTRDDICLSSAVGSLFCESGHSLSFREMRHPCQREIQRELKKWVLSSLFKHAIDQAKYFFFYINFIFIYGDF